MNDIQSYIQQTLLFLSSINLWDLSVTASPSFILIIAAEIGDKSQLVCMTLATRHRAIPILFAAIISFAFLNTLAVLFGSAIAEWFPEYVVSLTVALLFAVFGIHSLRLEETHNEEEIIEKNGYSIFFTTFLLITIAEFGDKTQLAVVALSSTTDSIAVWIGATTALIFTSALGIIIGKTLLQKLPLTLLHKISGIIFIILAVIASYNAYISFIQKHPVSFF